jgi:hypothetical protein
VAVLTVRAKCALLFLWIVAEICRSPRPAQTRCATRAPGRRGNTGSWRTRLNPQLKRFSSALWGAWRRGASEDFIISAARFHLGACTHICNDRCAAPKPRCRNLPAVGSGEGDARASLSSPSVLPQTLKKAVSPAVRRRRCFPGISHAFPVSEGAGPGPSRCARRPVRRCAFLSSPISSHRFGEGFQRSRSRH